MNVREFEKSVLLSRERHSLQTGCVCVRQVYQVLKAFSGSAINSKGPGSQEWAMWAHHRSEVSEHWHSKGERQGNRQDCREERAVREGQGALARKDRAQESGTGERAHQGWEEAMPLNRDVERREHCPQAARLSSPQ